MKVYKHGEAFCLMRYQTKDGMEMEVLWNSRDGVTPFGILSRTGREMLHVDWRSDRCVPDYKPFKGQRVFVDATPELILPKLRQYVDKFWNDSKWPMSERWASKDEAMETLLPEWCAPGSPTVIVWGEPEAATEADV